MRQLYFLLSVVAFLASTIGVSHVFASEYSLTEFKAVKAKKETNQKVLTNVITNYYLQPFRLSAKKPNVAVAEIAKLYKVKSKKNLPQSTRIELAQAIKNYQSKHSRQMGFENTRSLASILPEKARTASLNNQGAQ